MKYIVLDLEWNQCPDGKENEEALLPFEIIEIDSTLVGFAVAGINQNDTIGAAVTVDGAGRRITKNTE